MSSKLLHILSITLIFFAINALGQDYENEEEEIFPARYMRARPLRWGKRASTTNLLRWGKRDDPFYRWGKRQDPLRWGKRQDPLRWGKRQDPLRWGKRQDPLRWGKRQFEPIYLQRYGKRTWAPYFTPSEDDIPQSLDLNLKAEDESPYSWGTKFPIRSLDEAIQTAHLKALMTEALFSWTQAMLDPKLEQDELANTISNSPPQHVPLQLYKLNI